MGRSRLLVAALWAWIVALAFLAGIVTTNRVDEAAAFLDPLADRPAAPPDDDDPLDLDVCNRTRSGAFRAELAAFWDAVDDVEEIDETSTTLNSFTGSRAIVRRAGGGHRLAIEARRRDGAWCVDRVEHEPAEAG